MPGETTERPYSRTILTLLTTLCFGLFGAGLTIWLQSFGISADRAWALLAIMSVVFVASMALAWQSGRFHASSYRWQHWLALVLPILLITRLTAFFDAGPAPGTTTAIGPLYGLLDLTVLIISAVLGAIWIVGMRVARDIEMLHPQRSEIPPSIRSPQYYEWLTSRARYVDRDSVISELSQIAVTGGVILVALTAFSVLVAATERNPRMVTIALVVMVLYFIGVMLWLSYASLVRRTSQWTLELTSQAPGLTGVWIRSAVVILGIALAVAVLLPAFDADTAVGVGGWLLEMMFNVARVVIAAGLAVVALLSALVEFFRPERGDPEPLPPETSPDLGEQTGPAIDWTEIFGGVMVLMILVVGVYVLWRVLRGRSGGVGAVSEAANASMRQIRDILRAIVQSIFGFLRWTADVADALGTQVAKLAGARRRATQAVRDQLADQRRDLSPRDRIHELYAGLVHEAAGRGVVRRPGDTPSEFRLALAGLCASAPKALADLTTLFEAARYAPHQMQSSDAAQAEVCREALHAALREPDG